MKEDINKQKDVLCSWIGRHFFKMFILSRGNSRFNTVHVKILMAFSSETEKCILNLLWNEGQ